MEYVQTVLVQIEASKIDEASPLLAELDEHREFLRQQPGFEDMRVTRTINAEGNVLLVIETRWADDNSLVDYETGEPNVASIVRKHQALVVPDTLQVLDMEALRMVSSRGPGTAEEEATERLVLPLIVPVGALAFALLVIYGLSRVYLEIPNAAATGLAAGIAIGVLLTAWFVASRPSIQGWQIALAALAAAATLTGGAIFAVVNEDDGEAGAKEPPAAATPAGEETPTGEETPAAGLVLDVSMGDNFFEPNQFTVSPGEQVTFNIVNNGAAIHNMRVDGGDGEYNTDDDTVSEPDLFNPGDTGTLVWTAPAEAGTIIFRCDFHPIDMIGEIQVQ